MYKTTSSAKTHEHESFAPKINSNKTIIKWIYADLDNIY